MGELSNPAPQAATETRTPVSLREFSPILEIAAGVAVGGGAGFAMDTFHPASDRFDQDKELSSQIAYLEADKEILVDAQQLLSEDGVTSSEVDEQLAAKNVQIAEIRAQREEVGYDTMDSIQLLGVPVLLGAAAMAITFKRIRRTK